MKKHKKGLWWKNYPEEEISIRMAYVAWCRYRMRSKEELSVTAKKGWETRRKKVINT